ncbi:MAG: DUF47 family protein [Candidatus Aenigmatarchaeota archaeon]
MFVRKNNKIFQGLVKQSLLIEESSKTFQDILKDIRNIKSGWKELKRIESEADDIVHYITEEIEKIFILPLDKEDIKILTESLDDIIDNLEHIANRLYIFNIRSSNEALNKFFNLLKEAFENIHKGILILTERKFQSKDFIIIIEKLHELENKGDILHRDILKKLMNGKTSFAKRNLLLIMKWKEIFQLLEDTMDKCENFAIIFSTLRIKYS